MTHLRIRHTWNTRKHIMDKTEPKPCSTCGSEISIKHLLLECCQFNEKRFKFYIPNNLSKYLNNEPLNINNLLKYIKDTNLYKTI